MQIKRNIKSILFFNLFLFILFSLPIFFGGEGFVAHAITASPAGTDYGFWDYVTDPSRLITSLLLAIQTLMGWFVSASFLLVASFIDVTIVRGMLTSQAVTETWAAVRDVCNLAFILTLLFSAFATIFHVEKYHIKTIIVKLLLMALLINFSLPITRFIIDTGNVPMYYLANIMMSSSSSAGVGSQIAKQGNLICALIPYSEDCSADTRQGTKDYGENTSTAELIGSIILLFLFAITMVVVAVLFVIRTIALTIILIFSPLGFVGLAVPALNKYANEFWETLIKYVFFGPAMLFMIAVSVKLMAAMNGLRATNGSTGSGLIGAIMMTSVPIVILWIGMMVAQKSSIAGASTVTGMAQKFAKGAGRKFSGANFVRDRYKAYATERKKRSDLKFKDNWGERLGKAVNRKGYQLDELRGKIAHEGKIRSLGRTPLGIGATAAKKRAEEYFKNDWRETVKKKTDEHENDSINELTQKETITNAMDGLGSLEFNVNGKIEFSGPDAKEKKRNYEKHQADLAGRASQFIRRQGDDKKAHILDSIVGRTGEFTEMLKNAPQPVSDSLGRIEADPSNAKPQDLNSVMAFINQRMASVANKNVAS